MVTFPPSQTHYLWILSKNFLKEIKVITAAPAKNPEIKDYFL